MQTENTSVQLTSKQCTQLRQLKDVVKIKSLLLKFENLKTELENLTTERKECLAESQNCIERLNSLQEELKLAKKREFNWQIKLEKVKTFEFDNNDNVLNLGLLLGFQISKCQVLENNLFLTTLYYGDTCYVTYTETTQGSYNVLEIYPLHPKFSQIQKFLQESQDLRGLLACLRKFFDFELEFKKKDM